MATVNPIPAGAGAHPDSELDALEALWAILEESHDAHVGAQLDTETNLRWCRVALSGELCGRVIELAQAELYRRLLAAYAAGRDPVILHAAAAAWPRLEARDPAAEGPYGPAGGAS